MQQSGSKFHSKRLYFLSRFTRKWGFDLWPSQLSKKGTFIDMEVISQCCVENSGVSIRSRCVHVPAGTCVVFYRFIFLQKKCKLFIDWIKSDKLHYFWTFTFKCLDICFGILVCSAVCLWAFLFVSYDRLMPSRSVCFSDFKQTSDEVLLFCGIFIES